MSSVQKRTIRWQTKTGEQKTTTRWQARYRDRSGREHARLFEKQWEAKRWLDEETAAMVTGRWVDPRAGRETFEAYAERWRARQIHSPATVASFETILRNHIYPTLGGMPMDTIRSSDVQVLVKQWSESGAASTVETRYTVLSIVFRAAVRDRVIPESPCLEIKLPKPPAKSALVPITTDVVVALRDAMPDRYKALVTVAAGTGMRRGELLGLTLDRVAEDFGTIRVDRQLSRTSSGKTVAFTPPKTDASTRTIPVADVVIQAVREHVQRFGTHQGSGLIFTSEIGTPLRPSTLQRAWSRAAGQVGTDATLHALRHYFASVQIRGGQSIKVLQALLGHKSATETWDTYGHLMGDEDDRSRSVVQEALGNLADSTRTADRH